MRKSKFEEAKKKAIILATGLMGFEETPSSRINDYYFFCLALGESTLDCYARAIGEIY